MHTTGVTDPVVRITNRYILVTGRSESNQANVTLTLQSGFTRKEEELIIESSQKCDSIDLSGNYVVEGLLKLAEINNEQKLLDYAKRNTIVTANTSLIVLDNLDDYF